MKKLMKKKVSLFGKEFSVFAVVLVAMVGLASAALVPYISNTVFGEVNVDSPIVLEVTDGSENVIIADTEHFSVDIAGGETFIVETTLTVGTGEVTGHLGEMKIVGFDGIGMDVAYEVTSPATGEVWNIPPCTFEGDTYYYIGNPSDVFPAGTVLIADTTVETELNLMPGTYESESRVIMANLRACTGDAPTPVVV